MNTVLSLIVLIQQNNLKDDNYYLIARYILNHLSVIETISIQKMADDCHMSTNTILRFCHLLGFQSFRNFKSQLLSTMKTRTLQLKEKNAHFDFQNCMNAMKMMTAEFQEETFTHQLQEVVDLIQTYKKIYIYGATYPLALCQSFIEDMAILGIPVKVIQFSYHPSKIDVPEGVHIIISYSGRFLESNRDAYQQILNHSQSTVLISHKNDYHHTTQYDIKLPSTKSSYYDDFILMYIMDYLTVQCSQHFL